MEKLKIAFIQTGGTIDKDYPRKTGGYAFEIDKPAFERILQNLGPAFEFESHLVLKKDSQDITTEDREALKTFINDLTADKIIVTHGTDTLIETSKYLDGGWEKTIILVGAKLPERFVNSDASINLGAAIGAVQTLEHGVYVCMQGVIIPAANAYRDPDSGNFLDERN